MALPHDGQVVTAAVLPLGLSVRAGFAGVMMLVECPRAFCLG